MDTQALRDDLAERTGRIQATAAASGIEAVLIGDNANIYYTSGHVFRGYVYIPAEGDAIYFIIRPYGIVQPGYVYIRKPEQIPAELERLGLPKPATIGLELDQLYYSEAQRLMNVFPESKPVNVSGMLRGIRMVKSPYEINLMREDGIHQAAVYGRIRHLYSPDMTDVELQVEIERVLRLEGCLGYPRTYGKLMEINMGSVLNGENADSPTPYDFAVGGSGTDASLPVGASGGIMHPGTAVMIDMNGCFNGYQTDMTRVWSIGTLPDIALKAHETSRRILRELERDAIPGTPVSSLYEKAVDIAREAGLEEFFMGHKQKAAFIGHGVGIELNEPPVLTARSKEILEERMTIAIEPKFVIPHVGAVGVENTYVVRKDGLECITDYPEDIEEL